MNSRDSSRIHVQQFGVAADIFSKGRKIYQRIIMSMRIPVINLSSVSKQSGAEIESMIEHLEMREYFDLSFLGRIGALAIESE